MWQICKINMKSERMSPDRFSQHCRDFYHVYVLMVGYRSEDFSSMWKHFHWPWTWILFIISSDTYYSVRRDSHFDCSIKEWVHSLKSITFLFKHVYFDILSEDVCNNFLCWSLQPAMTGRLVLDKSVNTIQHKNRGPGWTRVWSTDESHWHHGWCDPVARLSLFICFLGSYMYCL